MVVAFLRFRESVLLKLFIIMKTRNFLIFLLVFLGVGAIYGGGLLIISPSGKLLGTPLSILETSPFKDFLIPGVLLFTVIGIIPLWLVRALLKKPKSALAESLNCFKDMHWSWSYTVYVGFALIIWIHVQEILINNVYFLHTIYMGWALLIIFVTQLPAVRKMYKKEEV